MNTINKFSCVILLLFIIILNSNIVYADLISTIKIDYTPSYYIAVILPLSIVIISSILILKKIYNDYQKENSFEQKETINKKEENDNNE